jgi:ubiquinone/menaquinone biosynthesis C-methylase UbiE
MNSLVNLYNTAYDYFSANVRKAVRAETYGEDIGQTSWMTADELREFIRLLALCPSSNVLEIGSGSGGPALFVAATVGCRITGIDVNEFGIKNSNELAQQQNLESLASFQLADASHPLPFSEDSFDAIIFNDAMCHVPRRLAVLREWYRVLKPGGQMLFTDAMVITGLISHEDIAKRSSIGFYFYVPPGKNEQLIKEAGFELVRCGDLTSSAANVSRCWYDARAKYRQDMVGNEGEENFDSVQQFLWCVHTLSSEGRLSRYMYLGRKPMHQILANRSV